MSQQKLAFYDILSNTPDKSISPWCFKVRYALNYKGIPYNLVPEIHPKIEALAKSIDAAPTGTKSDGKPFYTLPIIKDGETVVSDSTAILAYLDKAYPNTPKVNPEGYDTLQKAFRAGFRSKLKPYLALAMPGGFKTLPADSQPHCAIGWGGFLGKNEVDREVALKGVRDSLNEISEWMEEGQVFVNGKHPIDVDFEIGGFLAFLQRGCGEDSEDWKEIISWNNGRWNKLMQTLEKY